MLIFRFLFLFSFLLFLRRIKLWIFQMIFMHRCLATIDIYVLFKSHRIFWSFRGILRLFPANCESYPIPVLVLLTIASVYAAVVQFAQRVLGAVRMRRAGHAARGCRGRAIQYCGRTVCDGGRGVLLIQIALLACASLHGLPNAKDAQLGEQKQRAGKDQTCKETAKQRAKEIRAWNWILINGMLIKTGRP